VIELDLTKHSFRAMARWIPMGFWVTVSVCVFLGMVAWAFAWRGVRASTKAKDLEIFIAFPLTHLFFMPFFLWRDWKHARMSGAIYLSLFFVWWVGGELMQHHEQSELEQFQADIKIQEGYLSSLKSEKIFNDSDTDNIWAHPVLLPLVIMGEHSERGEDMRRNPPFESWGPPENFRIDSEFRASIRENVGKDLSYLYTATAGILHAQDPSFSLSMMPETWSEMGAEVTDYYKSMEQDFASLNEALERPLNIFPTPDQEGLTVPIQGLSYFRVISRAIRLRSSALLAMGESDDAHREAKLGLTLVKSGTYEAAISLLILASQTAIAIAPLETAQIFHCWNEEQWSEIDDILEGWNLIESSFDAIRGDRAFMSRFVTPILKQSTTQNFAYLSEAGVAIRGLPDWVRQSAWPLGLHMPFNWMTSGFSRALMTKQWIAYLKHMDHMVKVVGNQLQDPDNLSWHGLDRDLMNPDERSHGYIAALWGVNPALFEKLCIAQSKIRSARIGIALERYRIKNGQYPDTLGQLTDLNPELMIRDAWSGKSMLYERVGRDGFLLRMEDVVAAKKLGYDMPHHWFVPSKIPSMPVVEESLGSRNPTFSGSASEHGY
jgi:hypothetical protein